MLIRTPLGDLWVFSLMRVRLLVTRNVVLAIKDFYFLKFFDGMWHLCYVLNRLEWWRLIIIGTLEDLLHFHALLLVYFNDSFDWFRVQMCVFGTTLVAKCWTLMGFFCSLSWDFCVFDAIWWGFFEKDWTAMWVRCPWLICLSSL